MTSTSASEDPWTDHELMALYLALSYKRSERIIRGHDAYISTLPKPEDMRTPMYFTPAESQLLEGTNLSGAVKDRETTWRTELEAVKSRFSAEEAASGSLPTLQVVFLNHTTTSVLCHLVLMYHRRLPTAMNGYGLAQSSRASEALFPDNAIKMPVF
jgi:hypothetical protein